MEITFATKDTIKHPQNTFPLNKVRKETDHYMGSTGVYTGPAWEVLTDGHWYPFRPPSVEIQRNNFNRDNSGCESYSLNSAHRFVWKCRYNEDFNKDDRFLVVGSGTIPNVGNGTLNVAEWDRVNGWIKEGRWPYDPNTSIEVFYNGGVVPAHLLAEAKENAKTTEVGYKWLKDEKSETRKVGLTFSPVRTSVRRYVFDGTGTRVIDSGGDYIHEIVVFDFVDGVEWWAWDSENNQFIRFTWDYPFDSSMIHNIKMKTMFELVKEDGSPAVYLSIIASGNYYAIADSEEITGGDLLKKFSGTYNNANIKHVPAGTIQKEKIVGEIKAIKF